MRLHRWMYVLVMLSFLWLVFLSQRAAADEAAPPLTVDLNTALNHALRENLDLKAERQALGIAQGRVQESGLLFRSNPELNVDADYRHRRFAAPTGRSVADVEVRLLQEIEIAGQRGYRREAAVKNLAQAELLVADAERLLRLEVTRAFYDLLVLQEKIAAQQRVLSTQEMLWQAGFERFERGDISIVELDTLRFDKDRVQSDLLSREEERVATDKKLRVLLGLAGENRVSAIGNLLAPEGRARLLLPETLEVCALEQRPDMRAAHLNLEVREAELHLAQARRIPDVSLGPLYKLDNEDQVIGAALTIPLPLFNRNQQEITAALANLGIARTELEARRHAVKQEIAAAHARVRLAEERLARYGKAYFDNLPQSEALTQKAYEAGELSIFEFSTAQDRLVQARLRYFDAILSYLQAMAELEAYAASCTIKTESEGNHRGLPLQ